MAPVAGIELHAAQPGRSRPAGPFFHRWLLSPGDLLLILVGPDELPAGAVEGVEEAVAREVRHHLAGLAVDRDLVQQLGARRGPARMLVRRLLEIPDDLAGIGIERDGAGGEQVVAGAEFGIVGREGIAGAVVNRRLK